MAQGGGSRHLAAIMFMDMVGYSARMQENEPAAIAVVRHLWNAVRPVLAEHGGREVDLAGDGMMMEFPGALAAVRCALRVHNLLHDNNSRMPAAGRVRVRAGIHLGDVEHRDGRIYGDGVNIAARVIQATPPGSIGMSSHVRDQLLNVLDQPPQKLGLRTFKNIKNPMELWCLPGPDCSPHELAAAQHDDETAGRRWGFAEVTLDERSLELLVHGKPVSLEKKSIDVLLHLLRHAGEVVTKDELIAEVWPGRILSDSALTSCIAKLRSGLEDDEQQIIRTVHGFGYRLSVPVRVEAVHAEAAPRFDFHPGTKPPHRPLWSLVERVGTGGHGEAWLGRHDKTKELRIFKFALEPDALASLKREITLYRVLRETLGDRPFFARILDWNLEELPYFIESEYANFGNLAQWAEKKGGLLTLSMDERLGLVIQIAEALSAAHSVGVLHKDLKPTNVLIHEQDGKPQVRLCDFGSGGVLDQKLLEQMGITRMGFTKTVLDLGETTSGTPLYLAPEVISGQPFTAHADIYALGVILYQLVVGDLKHPLAPGWERSVSDALLREDIAAAADGNPAKRLDNASALAHRLRELPQRRDQRVREERARADAEQAQVRLRRRKLVERLAVFATVVLLIAAVPAIKYYRDAVAARQEAEAVSTFLSEQILGANDPNNGQGIDPTFKSVVQRAAAAVDKQLADHPAAAIRVHEALANSFSWLHDNGDMLAESRRALALTEQLYGRDSEEADDARIWVADSFSTNGKYVEAGAVYQQCLNYALRRWGEHDARTVALLMQLMLNQFRQALAKNMLETAKRLLQDADQVPKSERSGWWYFNGGTALLRVGEFGAAEAALATAEALDLENFGADHYATAWARLDHGQALMSLNRYPEAEAELRSASDAMTKWRGADNEQSITFHSDIGSFLVETGRANDGIALMEEDRKRCVEHCRDFPSGEVALHLGEAYLMNGRATEAVPVLREAVHHFEADPPGGWITAQAQIDLAEALLADGDKAEADGLLESAAKAIPGMPPRTPFLARLRRVQGLSLLKARQFDAARVALTEAQGICLERYGSAHWRTQRATRDLAAIPSARVVGAATPH